MRMLRSSALPAHATASVAAAARRKQRHAGVVPLLRFWHRLAGAGVALCCVLGFGGDSLFRELRRARVPGHELLGSSFVGPTSKSLPLLPEPSERALLARRARRPPQDWSEFSRPSGTRSTSGRGKKGHFQLLDRYIRRIDALVPQDMENLVKPLSETAVPSAESNTLVFKFMKSNDIARAITEEELIAFIAPVVPEGVLVGHCTLVDRIEAYAQFKSSDDAKAVRRLDRRDLVHGGEQIETVIRFAPAEEYDRIATLRPRLKELGYSTIFDTNEVARRIKLRSESPLQEKRDEVWLQRAQEQYGPEFTLKDFIELRREKRRERGQYWESLRAKTDEAAPEVQESLEA
mmetsp:Transcript_16790/g.43395  ORF Transcript_16790/g.43395 Transcript_16790/m.43395 type:complete len:348 (-) Transcript_16790:96-1139(-)